MVPSSTARGHEVRRSRRRWPWVVALALALVLVGAAVALPLVFDVERHRGRIEAALASATGWRAELGRIGFSVWRGLVLTVSPVRLTAPGDTSRLEIETLEIRATILPLLRGRLEITSVDLVRPSIRLVRPSRAAGWVLPVRPAGSEGAPAAEGGPPVAVMIGTVAVAAGTLVVEDRTSAPPWSVTLAEVTLDLAPGAGSVDGRGVLQPAGARLAIAGSLGAGFSLTLTDLPTESLHPFLGTDLIHAGGKLSGQVELARSSEIRGTIVGRSVTLLAGETPLDELRATLHVLGRGPSWKLESLALDAGRLKVTGAGSLVPVDLRFSLAETPLDAALAAAPSILPLPLDLRPPGAVRADVRVVATARGPLATTATGELSAARFVPSDVLPPVENVHAAFELGRDGALEVRILGGTIAGGPATGVARLSSIDPPGKLTFDGALEDAALGAMLAGFVDKAEAITGPTALKTRLALDLARPAVDARALSGRLDLDSRDVRFPRFDLERAVVAKLEEKLGPLAALAGRGGSADAGAGTTALLRTLTASVDFDRFPWGLERLALEAEDLAAAGAGTFDPTSGAVALDLTARLGPERTARLVERAKQLARLVDRDGRLALPLKVRGGLLAPTVEVDLEKAIGGREAVQDLIRGLLDRKDKKED